MTKQFLLLLLVIFIETLGFSQSTDTKLWAGLEIEKEINKKIIGSLEFEQRFDNNISSFDKLLIEPAISYKLNKKWSFYISYRLWYQRNTVQVYELHSRTTLGVSFDKKIKGVKLKLASKMQYGIPDLSENNFYFTRRLVSRNSLKLSYEIFGSRFTPFLKYELFTSLKRLNLLNYQWRLITGTSIYLNKALDLKLYYALEHEFNVVNKMNSNIFGIGIKYSL